MPLCYYKHYLMKICQIGIFSGFFDEESKVFFTFGHTGFYDDSEQQFDTVEIHNLGIQEYIHVEGDLKDAASYKSRLFNHFTKHKVKDVLYACEYDDGYCVLFDNDRLHVNWNEKQFVYDLSNLVELHGFETVHEHLKNFIKTEQIHEFSDAMTKFYEVMNNVQYQPAGHDEEAVLNASS